MNTIKRVYVEKKKGYDMESSHLYKELKNNLGIKGLTNLRILNRYDVEFLSDEHYEICKKTIFSEPPVDNIYEEEFPLNENDKVFPVEFLKGQFNQRADSALQCIQIITSNKNQKLETAKVYVLSGNISNEEFIKIKNHCINTVDSTEAKMEKPLTLDVTLPLPKEVKNVDNFCNFSDDEILKFRLDLGLAMNENDLEHCKKYFKEVEKRDPSMAEIRVIDTYWSDHCRHTTFLTSILNVEVLDGTYKKIIDKAYKLYIDERQKIYKTDRDITLMDLAVIGMKALKNKGVLTNLDESEEINACSIVVPVDIDGVYEDWLIMFKNETHNHPTEIEPFGGAATCLGGAIRDPLSGRSYVYQAMRVTGSGDCTAPISSTISGKLPQRKISTTAASGYSSYGNQIGLATGIVNEIYNEGYIAKHMEVGAVIGAAPKENVRREVPTNGDVIILVGGATGRDGCGGATGSSKEHDEDSILTCGAEVQKGNAPTERKLQRLFRNKEVSTLIKRCNDFGAGGVSVAIGELADGLVINLDKIPKKYKGLDPIELAISESQERMAVVVDSKDADIFINYANNENLEATVVANVTDNRRLVMKYNEKDVVNLSRDFLDTNGAKQTTSVIVGKGSKLNQVKSNDPELLLKKLSELNIASQKGLSERFDSTIGAGTVLMPFGGKNQLTPIEAMVAKVPVLKGETTTVTLMSYGYNPEVAQKSQFHGGLYAVVDSISKIVATGGSYKDVKLTFQEYFERMSSDPLKWGKPFGSLLGAFYGQMMLETAAIGGKDSMSGTFKDINVPPTLVSFAVGVGKIDNIISPEFKKVNSVIVKLTTEFDNDDVPNFAQLKANFSKVFKLISTKKVISASTIGNGGVGVAIAKMCFGNGIGANINCKDLYKYEYGSFILELDVKNKEVHELFEKFNYEIIGNTASHGEININNLSISIEEAQAKWLGTFEKVFPTNIYESEVSKNINLRLQENIYRTSSKINFAKPRVFIPIFPGTNCEYDTIKAYEKAGAIVETLVIKNINDIWLNESIEKMANIISNSQIVTLAGGFSAGDEPDGSGKFIAACFRNKKIAEAITSLLNEKDGLMLGICNGFQALIKLGLLPYGAISEIKEDSPTLTYNEIGRHISSLCRTKIISNKSPWLYETATGDEHIIPFSHGEGRFVANDDIIKMLIENDQIATQYVNENGQATLNIKNNPNGSMFAIEGITSYDGRVLGKMGHSERIGHGLYKNVAGNNNQFIFESGVKYFR